MPAAQCVSKLSTGIFFKYQKKAKGNESTPFVQVPRPQPVVMRRRTGRGCPVAPIAVCIHAIMYKYDYCTQQVFFVLQLLLGISSGFAGSLLIPSPANGSRSCGAVFSCSASHEHLPLFRRVPRLFTKNKSM